MYGFNLENFNSLVELIRFRILSSHGEKGNGRYETNSTIDHILSIFESEKVIVLIAIAPHLQPSFYDDIIKESLPNGGDFPEFGGVRGANHRGLLPTGETAQFILAGNDIEKRLEFQKLLTEGALAREGIITLETVKEGEPAMSGRLILPQEWLDKILFGKEATPKFSLDFPAKRIATQMEWADLVLHPHTREQINDIRVWLEHHNKINEDKNLSRKIKPGYRILFYGPSGTGKTLTATLLGKEFQKEVYRIDLSQVVSKYIGETEKNLEKVFNRAENKDWILFFDEADSLFGKRTNVQSAHDKYANQEVAYLLQRVEDFPGLLILASNFKSNMDDAFTRRFHSVVHFPMPNDMERMSLWKKSLPQLLQPEKEIDWFTLASKYDLTGAGILNVVHYATLKSFSRNDECLRLHDLLEGVRREFGKEEKSI
jgi:hypothetical protein